MDKREKRLIKQIRGLRKQINEHAKKIIEEKGKKDTTPHYWKSEIERFEKQIQEKWDKLVKLKKKK